LSDFWVVSEKSCLTDREQEEEVGNREHKGKGREREGGGLARTEAF